MCWAQLKSNDGSTPIGTFLFPVFQDSLGSMNGHMTQIWLVGPQQKSAKHWGWGEGRGVCKRHSSREAIKGDPYVANTANLRQRSRNLKASMLRMMALKVRNTLGP